jgi:uncharacterized membrane protein YcfT
VTIQFALRAPGTVAEEGLGGTALAYLYAYVEPFGTLWFIYLLPIFFIVTKLMRGVAWWIVFIALAALEIAPIETGSIVIDEFASRFVFFYIGYALAEPIFRFARRAQERPAAALGGLAVWAFVNNILVLQGWAGLPFVSLALGFAGAVAVVAASALFARLRLFDLLRYCGEHTLIVYLAFSLFMASTRIVLLRLGLIPDLGTVALIVTAAGVTGPLILHLMVRRTPARYLFVRPQWARLGAGRLASPATA